MPKLCNQTLGRLPSRVAVPGYDRSRVSPGIAHIGVGNFHRMHQAVFIDRCLHHPGQESWGIIGVGLRCGAGEEEKAEAFRRQDGLYTVTEYGPNGDGQTRVIGAMIDYLYAPQDPERVLTLLATPAIRIVTLTITEKSYNIDERTGTFRVDDPEIARDLAERVPGTVFGILTEALARRCAAGVPPFAVVSCDNLRHNGDTTRAAVAGFAHARDPELAQWIERNVAFPNGMVDRIAPTVTEEDRRRLNAQSGVDDLMPAMGESFIQWVVESRFLTDRPALDAVGVELRDDVALFEAAKGRILNAAHMMLAYPALLCGYRMVHEAMSDERLAGYLRRFLLHDAIPLIEGPPGVALPHYAEMVLERFGNPAVEDQLMRIAQDGAVKIPVFHRRTIEMLLDSDGPLTREAFFLASFARFLDGRDDAGQAYEVVEPTLSEKDHAELRAPDGLGLLRTSPFAVLRLEHSCRFVRAYREAASAIACDGVKNSLETNDGRDW